MNSIDLMMEEHKNIKRMLKVVRIACYSVLNGESIKYEDFYKIIDFIRNYADKYHHGKEEKFLFKEMVDHLGSLGEKLVNYGMLVEHDLGRLYIKELEEALEKVKDGDEESKLDVIANAISYTHLLTRHIEKEDNTVYTFAQRQLSKEILDKVDAQSEEFQINNSDVDKKYLSLLIELEKKYGLQ